MDANASSSRLALELLEDRLVLNAAPVAAPVAATTETAQDPITITAVHLQIGDRELTVEGRHNTVVFEPGEQLNVTAIDYVVTSEANELEGVIAFEGYLRHSQPESLQGNYDYSDGRFRDPMSEDPIADGTYQHGGLEGGWELAAGHNRLSLALVRYFEDSFAAENHYIVNLQAGESDLRFGGAYYKRADDGILFGAVIANKGTATVSTYTEIDVYDENDQTTPIWVGVALIDLQPGESSFVTYRNDNSSDAFADLWVPEERGRYVVKFSIDPENVVAETDKSNNLLESKIKIKIKV